MYSQQRYWSANYVIHLLMLDMLKTFDAINRSMLMQELAKVLDPNRLHIIEVLTNPQLSSKSGAEMKRVMLSKQILVSLRVTVCGQTSLHFILQKHWTATNMTMITAAP